MSLKYLGETFEIHGGGRDLIFPHHENEIAQSESHTGKQFAKIWMHVGMMTINGEKMSKSLGNIKSVKYVLDHWGPNIIRLFCLSGHYSKPIDYSEELLRENIVKWRQVENCYFELRLAEGQGPIDDVEKIVLETTKEFEEGMESDFNTPMGLHAFFKLVKETNRFAASEMLTQSISRIVLPEFEKMLETLGLKISKITDEEKSTINDLIKKRNMVREQKQYQEADSIRKQILEMGITLIDHKNRTLWMKQEKIGIEN
jgi:cysteinyl-tRNA synthetase